MAFIVLLIAVGLFMASNHFSKESGSDDDPFALWSMYGAFSVFYLVHSNGFVVSVY